MLRRASTALLIGTAFALALALASGGSYAQEAPRQDLEPDRADAPPAASWTGVSRPLLYTADPTPPPPGHVLATLGVSYAAVDRGAARPFAADVAHAGAVFGANADVGLTRIFALHAEGLLAGDGGSMHAGAMLGAGLYPLSGRGPFDIGIAAGYLRELGGANGAWARAVVAADIGRARLALGGVTSHVFSPGRDGVDVLVTGGASYAVLPILRIGAEYVAQDLEEAFDQAERDGGIRHFAGATAALTLGDRVQITAGPAFGLNALAPRVLGKLSASYRF
jgi:hypothetical protein